MGKKYTERAIVIICREIGKLYAETSGETIKIESIKKMIKRARGNYF